MNLAILISNSEYIKEGKLPACDNDLKIIKNIIDISGKFEEKIVFHNNKSNELKEKIAQKIQSIKNEKWAIDELFLYYSGHGLYREQQFFYIPIDYDNSRHNSTSLGNDELDELMRSLSPKIMIKVIDACESSQNYIKMLREEKKEYLEKSKGKFDDCYFLFSSGNSQSSYQNENISDFTQAFIDAIRSTQRNTIRYSDIISYIADEFSENRKQTPYFVSQGKFTETFSDDLLPLKESLKKYYDGVQSPDDKDVDEINPKPNLFELVNKNAKEYIKKDDALKTIESIKSSVLKFGIMERLEDLYNLEISSIDTISTLPAVKSLFRDIESQENNIFVEIERDEETYEEEIKVPRHITHSLFRMFEQSVAMDIKTVTRKRTIIVGFEQSMKTSSSGFSITLTPKLDNLNMYSLYVFFLFNKNDFILYKSCCEYYDKNWGDWVLIDKNNWRKQILPFNDLRGINKELENYINDFQENIYIGLKSKYEKEI